MRRGWRTGVGCALGYDGLATTKMPMTALSKPASMSCTPHQTGQASAPLPTSDMLGLDKSDGVGKVSLLEAALRSYRCAFRATRRGVGRLGALREQRFLRNVFDACSMRTR